ncbi:MAG TPA: hypothetical protein VMK12_11890 [Anaeromyxobacteraceae bacterium]|nr:hypothetical protein [Anaeromyxobacteraceae bacterium]
MIRVVAWTVGLFAVGCGICHLFPEPFVEPLVLLALGATLYLVSGRAPSSPPTQVPTRTEGQESTAPVARSTAAR